MGFLKELEFWLSSLMPSLLPLLPITFHVLSMHTNTVPVQIKDTDKKSNEDFLYIYTHISVEAHFCCCLSVLTYFISNISSFTSLIFFTCLVQVT